MEKQAPITLPKALKINNSHGNLFIGLPKENSFQENRIALVPAAVKVLTARGIQIIVESGAGESSRFSDIDYSEAGAKISYDRTEVMQSAVLLKVAPLSFEDIQLCSTGSIIISPIHLPTLKQEYLQRLQSKRLICLAMENIKDAAGSFPFLRMMSQMVGISAIQIASELLTGSAQEGSRGILLGGIAGVPPAKVLILGAGVVAEFAARAALGFGAEVRIFDDNIRKLMRIQQNLGQRVFASAIDPDLLGKELTQADVAIGALHVGNGRTPMVVTKEMVANMKKGAVIVDVSIDQGGCFETSKVTSHKQPTYLEYDIIHYCVPNIASRTPRTGSHAFSNILLPLLFQSIESNGLDNLLRISTGLQQGIYIYQNYITNKYIADKFGFHYTNISLLLGTNLQ